MQNMCAVHGPMPRTHVSAPSTSSSSIRRPSLAKSMVPSRVLSTRSKSDRRFGPLTPHAASTSSPARSSPAGVIGSPVAARTRPWIAAAAAPASCWCRIGGREVAEPTRHRGRAVRGRRSVARDRRRRTRGRRAGRAWRRRSGRCAPWPAEPTGWVEPRLFACHGPRRRCPPWRSPARSCSARSPSASSLVGQPSSAGAGPLALPNPAPASAIRYGEPPLKVLLVGDSMAGSLGVGLEELAGANNVELANAGHPGCSLSMDGQFVLTYRPYVNNPGLPACSTTPTSCSRSGSPGSTRSAPTSSCTSRARTCSTSRSTGAGPAVGPAAVQRLVLGRAWPRGIRVLSSRGARVVFDDRAGLGRADHQPAAPGQREPRR